MSKSFMGVLLLVLGAGLSNASGAGDTERFRVYAGSWKIARSGTAKPDELVNTCAPAGRYFVCQQMVNGEVAGLIIFIAGNDANRYRTQNVLPNGRPTGAGDLEITPASKGQKETWVFFSAWNQGSQTTHYRTTNVFADKNHIHFVQEESGDGKNWKTTGEGDDTRTAGAR